MINITEIIKAFLKDHFVEHTNNPFITSYAKGDSKKLIYDFIIKNFTEPYIKDLLIKRFNDIEKFKNYPTTAQYYKTLDDYNDNLVKKLKEKYNNIERL